MVRKKKVMGRHNNEISGTDKKKGLSFSVLVIRPLKANPPLQQEHQREQIL